MGRVQEAIIHFREAIRLAPCRLDCYEGKTKIIDEKCESVDFCNSTEVEGSVRPPVPKLWYRVCWGYLF